MICLQSSEHFTRLIDFFDVTVNAGTSYQDRECRHDNASAYMYRVAPRSSPIRNELH